MFFPKTHKSSKSSKSNIFISMWRAIPFFFFIKNKNKMFTLQYMENGLHRLGSCCATSPSSGSSREVHRLRSMLSGHQHPEWEGNASVRNVEQGLTRRMNLPRGATWHGLWKPDDFVRREWCHDVQPNSGRADSGGQACDDQSNCSRWDADMMEDMSTGQ